MAAPKLSFSEKEKEKREARRGPGPPPPIRDPKKHSIFSNIWAGIETMPRGFLEQEEELRHAVAKDVESSQGLAGLVSYPWALAIDATRAPFSEKRLKELKRQAAAPWTNRKKGNALSPVLVRMGKEGYESTRQATGTRGLKKFKEIWHDNPVAALGSVLVVGGPVSRSVGAASMASKIAKANRVPLKGGGTRAMTKTEALKAAAVESYYPGMLDKLGIEGSPFKPRVSGRRVSRSPYGRASQRAFDWASEKIDTGAIPKLGPDTPFSATRRAAAGKRRAGDLERGRLVTNAMRHVSTFADYLNDSQVARIGTALGRRKDTLAYRDAAVGAALHASSSVDPVEAVRLAAEDTKGILQSGKRSAHQGDIGDLAPEQREGQTVYVTHGIDEEGAPIREESVVIADLGDRVMVGTPGQFGSGSDVKTIPNGRAHLVGPNGEGEIPLSADEIKMLERRYDHLTEAHAELLEEPRLQEKFRAATQSMSDLGQLNEQLGIDYFTRGMDPTGSEALAIRERLTARRNQFLPRLGGEGADAIDYYSGLWGDLVKTLEKSGKYTDDQQFVFLSILDRQARVWANEVEGRQPADYLASPEGARIGGIDYSKPEDLEATVNRMFQTEGERFNLLKRTTTALIRADPQVGDLVSTPKGMGYVKQITTEENGREVMIEMAEGVNVHEFFPIEEVRVSEFPWMGHPQVNDYVQTPDGPGRLESVDEGPGPNFERTYTVTLFDDVNGFFVDGERLTYRAGQVQRIEDPHETGEIFELASQKALGTPGFPQKATSEQYRRALEKQGVKSDEFYWLGLSRRPMMEDQLRDAQGEMKVLEKNLAKDPAHDQVYGGEERDRAQAEIDRAQANLDAYDDDPDPSFILDVRWKGGSFPVAAIEDTIKSSSNFLNLKETLYSSEARDYQFRDQWGPNRGDSSNLGLIIRDPDADSPYYELVIALPESDLYPRGHYPRHGNESPLVHIRFHETVSTDGVRTILIDELQSDWNNAGRTGAGWKGILSPLDERTARHMRDRERRVGEMRQKYIDALGVSHYDIDNWYDRVMRDAANELNAEIEARNVAAREAYDAALDRGEEAERPPREQSVYPYSEEDIPRVRERADANHADDPAYKGLMEARDKILSYNARATRYRAAADAIEGSANGTNRGPLVMGDAPKYLAMKRMVRWAADHGQTRIIWLRGHETGVRYSLFNDLPIRERHQGRDLDPSDYDMDFYYPYNSDIIDSGGYYQTIGGDTGLSEAHLAAMRNAPPVEISWDNPDLDSDHVGDEYLLIPESSLKEVPNMSGQLALGEEIVPPPFDPAGAPNFFPRHGKIVSDDGETVLVRPLDPEWDPARFSVDYRGDTGESSYSHWDINIVSRAGESIYNNSIDGDGINGLEGVLQAVANDWEARIHRRWDGIPQGEIPPGARDAEIAKMHDAVKALADSPHVNTEFQYMLDHVDYEFDSNLWDEFVANYEDPDGEGGEAEGDFREIRDFQSVGHRRLRDLQTELEQVKARQALDRERGVETIDYAEKIEATQREIAYSKDRLPNKSHSYGYDVMMPKVANALLKPYKNEADFRAAEIREEIFYGRYSSETNGVISSEGKMHGWVMDLPQKMLDDAKGTQTLFQREGRKINAEEIAALKGIREVSDLKELSRLARKDSDYGRSSAYDELVYVYGADNPYLALKDLIDSLPEKGRGHGNANHYRVLIAEMRRMERTLGAEFPIFQKGNDIVKGASTWVGGPDGKRFIALTEHADFSTLMHEFIGHATEEMKRRYPELFEAVERDMGKPLESWTRANHEKFAKQVERYWMEGKAPSPELHTAMKMIKEWMKAVYASITMLGRPMPDSTRILLNRHLGAGITARPGARSYVPHVSQFDTMMDTAPGGTRLAAGGNVVGVPQVDKRNFGARRNRGILWQSGELALSARPIIDQYFRRTKFMETEAVRQEMFDEGHPLPRNGRAPEGAWLVRNPEAAPERLTARNKSKLSEEDFARMIGEGDTPEEFVTKMEEIRKDHYAAPGEHPAWANDLENVRWVEAGKINARIQNVFPTAPRGRVAASAGSLNTMARLAGIYLRPLHYLVGNIPQNVLMVALTNPSALVNSVKYGAYSFLPRTIREMAVQPRDLFAHDRHLYNQIKTETGDIQAGAGLPDFYTMANNNFQKGERRLNKISQGTAEKLGEIADQPYRVSVWIAHAKKYGYNTPDEWRKLLDSERGTPEARIRDDIAQQTREDMIDFNTLSPGERQNISRFFYLWAFTRGFAKWPVTFAREYPGRTGAAMMLADPEMRDDNGVLISALPASGILKSNKGRGKIRDLTFLDPTSGFRQQVETGIQLAHGNFQGVGGMTTPPLETGLQAITGGPRAPKGGLGGLADQLARDTVPFWDIGKKATTPGITVSERVKRVLDFTDRFGVKEEIGKGKNAEKKRKEDEKIRRVLTTADRLDALPQVMHQQDAYWHHKYLEQQIRFGAQARRKGTSLTDEEKLTILYATAADYYPDAELPPLTEALKAGSDLQEKYRNDLRDSMFGLRNEATR